MQAFRNARVIRRRAIQTKKTDGRKNLTTGRRGPIRRPATRNRTIDRVVSKARNIAACMMAQIEKEEYTQAVMMDPSQQTAFVTTNVFAAIDEEEGPPPPPGQGAASAS